jgi:hypothetical protein
MYLRKGASRPSARFNRFGKKRRAERTCRSDKSDARDHELRMRNRGTSRGGCLTAGLMIGLITYLVLLQGLATSYAKTWMAVDQLAPAFIICSPLGTADQPDVDPLELIVKECCSALCAAASSVGPTLQPSETGSFEFRPVLSNDDPLRPRSQRAPPGEPGAIKDARAPPAFSI